MSDPARMRFPVLAVNEVGVRRRRRQHAPGTDGSTAPYSPLPIHANHRLSLIARARRCAPSPPFAQTRLAQTRFVQARFVQARFAQAPLGLQRIGRTPWLDQAMPMAPDLGRKPLALAHGFMAPVAWWFMALARGDASSLLRTRAAPPGGIEYVSPAGPPVRGRDQPAWLPVGGGLGWRDPAR